MTESLLQLATIAVGQTGAGGCNEGFLRPGAPLHVVVITDEAEQSGVPWSQWVAELQGYAPTVVSGVVDRAGDCAGGPGGYLEAAEATGGQLLDICDSGWPLDAATLAPAGGVAPQTVILSGEALQGTLEVTVDGQPISDFSYDPASGALSLTELVATGAAIEVSYAVAGACAAL